MHIYLIIVIFYFSNSTESGMSPSLEALALVQDSEVEEEEEDQYDLDDQSHNLLWRRKKYAESLWNKINWFCKLNHFENVT